jgi:hypothetical protein
MKLEKALARHPLKTDSICKQQPSLPQGSIRRGEHFTRPPAGPNPERTR